MSEPSMDASIQAADKAISYVDIFENLPDERSAFYRVAKKRRVDRKETLFLEGDVASSVFYILKGLVIVTMLSSNGKEVALYIHKKGALLGVQVLTGNTRRRASAYMLNDGIIYEVQNQDFKSLVARYPVLYDRIMLQMAMSFNFMCTQYLSAFTDDAETRLKKLLARLFSEELLKPLPDSHSDYYSLNVTEHQLASSIGVSRETISKLLGRMQQAGLIDRSAHKISFIKPEHFLNYLET